MGLKAVLEEDDHLTHTYPDRLLGAAQGTRGPQDQTAGRRGQKCGCGRGG